MKLETLDEKRDHFARCEKKYEEWWRSYGFKDDYDAFMAGAAAGAYYVLMMQHENDPDGIRAPREPSFDTLPASLDRDQRRRSNRARR